MVFHRCRTGRHAYFIFWLQSHRGAHRTADAAVVQRHLHTYETQIRLCHPGGRFRGGFSAYDRLDSRRRLRFCTGYHPYRHASFYLAGAAFYPAAAQIWQRIRGGGLLVAHRLFRRKAAQAPDLCLDSRHRLCGDAHSRRRRRHLPRHHPGALALLGVAGL